MAALTTVLGCYPRLGSNHTLLLDRVKNEIRMQDCTLGLPAFRVQHRASRRSTPRSWEAASVSSSPRSNSFSSPRRRFSRVRASSADVSTHFASITFQIGETSLSLPFSRQAAKGLSEAIDKVFATFKEKEKATRPQRWESMDFRQSGSDGVSSEFFCNPNAYSNVFQAKVLITVKDDRISLTTEGLLSGLKSSVDDYLERLGR